MTKSKYFISFVALVLLLNNNLYAKDSLKQIEYVLKQAKNKEQVVLVGNIISQTDDDEFILKDISGEVQIDINDQLMASLSSKKLIGAKVAVVGSVDKEILDLTEVNVFQIRLLEEGKKDLLSDENLGLN
jgi:uncharacterized protein (TIGR00156 family)